MLPSDVNINPKKMNPRLKKYLDRKKADDGSKKGSANKEGYNEENPQNIQNPKDNPAPSKEEDALQSEISKKNSQSSKA